SVVARRKASQHRVLAFCEHLETDSGVGGVRARTGSDGWLGNARTTCSGIATQSRSRLGLRLGTRAFAEVGLKTDYGGPPANGVIHMALLGFEDGSYLELIAPQKPGAVEGSDWAKFMAANAGACAWAVRVRGFYSAEGPSRAIPGRTGRRSIPASDSGRR